MSQEDRVISHTGSQRDDQFVYLEQRSCRCSNSTVVDDIDDLTKIHDRDSQTSSKVGTSLKEDEFVVEIENEEDPVDNQQNEHQQRHLEIQIRNNEITNDVQTISTHDFNVNDEIDHFSHDGQKISTPGTINYRADESIDDDPDGSNFIISRVDKKFLQNDISEQHALNDTRQGRDFSHVDNEERDEDEEDEKEEEEEMKNEDRAQDRSTIDTRNMPLSETRSSPVRIINDERPSTGGSLLSFATSSSSNDPKNDPRAHSRLDTSLDEITQNHSHQQITSTHHQLPIMNVLNANRSNLRTNRENCRNTDNIEGNIEIDEIHRINSNSTNVPYNSGFRNLHNDHILQPLNRGTNFTGKGQFDSIQISESETMEKGKCQCHRIQQHQHQHQQRLSHIQQLERTHQHHHHRHQHRHASTQQHQQRNQQEEKQQTQQQHYRHHHYHHPHQHIGQQQQDHQRSQNDEIVARKQRNGTGPDDECENEMMETSLGAHQPPALPPRPPPRPNMRYEPNAIASYDIEASNGQDAGCCKKYVVLCCLCGGLSAAVGSLFLAVHAVLSAHTASLALFETVPSYIPGTMLILMGLFTILLARRKHRYGFLMKMCGSVGVVCALVCVLVTVTTTVVHMSRLQGLRECVYTIRARSCTCYGSTQGRVLSDPGVLFEETPHCEAVHGALYDCLRALFGVSVAGILACIFSCMLLYQLLSHEKKKMYWEQLQLRCRSLYGQGGSGAVGGPTGGSCGCCNDCGGASPWWAQTPGNLYTPNPDLAPFRRWRLPWTRSRGPAPTPDSNYGFHSESSRGAIAMRSSDSSSVEHGEGTTGPYSVLTDESQNGVGPSYSLLNGTNSAPYAACASSVASYSLLENGPLPPLWGPPPPYSDPNSPARRAQSNDERRVATSIRSTPPIAKSVTTPINISTNNRIANNPTIENFDSGNCEEYRQQRGMRKRPSDNYENTEEVLSSVTDQDIEMGNFHRHHHHHLAQNSQDEDTTKGRRLRKILKGVENGGFQQENGNSLTKQSESELYFGDVSSCCGPESSFYDLAMEKEQQQSGSDPVESLLEYPTSNRSSKQQQQQQRQASKRSRLPLPLPALNSETSIGSLTENYAALNNSSIVEDAGRNSSTRSGPFLAPDAQYEVIAQQTRYTYYNTKNGDHVHDVPISSLASLAYRSAGTKNQHEEHERSTSTVDYLNDCQMIGDRCENDGNPIASIVTSPSPSILSLPPSPMLHITHTPQRCPNDSTGTIRDAPWPADHQTRTQSNVEGVCPVNV